MKELLLCTWDPAHRLQLVANDIRVDKLGVDVELMFVPCYAQIPKDIAAMYACCNYGKQYEVILKTTNQIEIEIEINYIAVSKRVVLWSRPCGGLSMTPGPF